MTIANAKPDLLITGPIGTTMVNAASSAWHDYLTVEAKITAAIAYAVSIGAKYCYVPDSFLPYTASLVTFNPAVKMTCEGSNPTWWDVRAYGAAGDNSTNDYAAFNAAHAGLPAVGGTLYVPGVATSYKIGAEWLITKPCMILGDGLASKVTQTAATNTVHVQAVNGVVIRGLWLVGSGLAAAAVSANVVYFDATNDSELTECTLDGGRIHNFFADGCSRCIVSYNVCQNVNAALGENDAQDIRWRSGTASNNNDNLIIGNKCRSANKQGGIMFQQIALAGQYRRNRIVENFVDSAIQNGITTGHGIVLYSTDANGTLWNNTISLNVIQNCQGIGIYLAGGGTNTVQENIVIGNQILNATTVGSTGTLPDGAIGLTGATRNRIMGNVINSGGNGTAAAINVYGASDFNVFGENVAFNLGSFGNGGMQVKGGARLQIIGNYFDGPNAPCIFTTTGSGDQHQIIANICNAGLDRGIVINVGNDCLVSNNLVQGCASSAFVALQASVNRTRFLNNTALNNGGANPFRVDNGTNTEWSGNRASATGALQGRAVLVGGTVTVNTIEVLTGDNIRLTKVVKAGTDGFVEVSAIVNVTSFTILSSNGADTGTVFWEIVH